MRADGLSSQDRTAAPAHHLLLDVPYLPQTEALCGGAALAMVLRYWGVADALPQDFATLVDPHAGGIHTSAIVQAATDRGWRAQLIATSGADPLDAAQTDVDRGRPLIALLEVRPRTFHYVVVVGVTSSSVVVHDPADRPFVVIPRDEFETRWRAAGAWLLLIEPRTPIGLEATTPSPHLGTTESHTAAADVSGSTPSCATLVAASVTAARENRQDDAERGLLAATSLCPAAASGWRELAGLRFVEHRYDAALAFATRAVALDPRDVDAWRLVAASRYLAGRSIEALDAWNRAGVPRIDTIDVDGLRRARVPMVIARTGLRSRQILTRSALARATLRLEDWPIGSSASVRYDPIGAGDTAAVHVFLNERPAVSKGLFDAGAIGVRAIFAREISTDLVDPARAGEVWTGAYRWYVNRPRVAGGLVLPAPSPLFGPFSLDASWEKQSYAPAGGSGAAIVQRQRHAGAALSDWATDRLKWQAGAGIDRFDTNDFASIRGAIETRWWSDHVAVSAAASSWRAVGSSAAPFSSGTIAAAWRSVVGARPIGWSAHGGMTVVGAAAPLAAWPIASSSSVRGELLRAHDLYHHGIIDDEIFGRRLAFGSVEYARRIWERPFARVSAAGFVDTARSWARLAPGSSPFEVDIGAGLRVSTPGARRIIRLDAAYGLRDGRTSLSAGYVLAFGAF